MRSPGQESNSRFWRRALYLLLSLVTSLLLVVPLTDSTLLGTVYVHFSYYLILGVFLLWGACLYRAARAQGFSLRSFVHANGIGILWSLLLTGAVFLSIEPGYRVLSDETSLISTSQSMTYRQTVDIGMMGKAYFGNFELVSAKSSKRPLLFPFFVHLLHVTLGYSANNAFVLNGVALFGLVFITFYCTRRFLGTGVAVGASLLLICQPILTISATSAGFEVFSILFFGIAALSLLSFVKAPNSNTFLLLWANLLALSHTRYEAPAYMGVILLLLYCFGYLKRSYFSSNTLVYALTPLLLLPIIWQRIIGFTDHETATGVAAFGFDHLLEHSLIFLRHQLDFGFILPYATAANLLGWVALGLIAVDFKQGRLRFENRYAFHFFAMLASCFLIDLVVHLAYHDGLYTHPSMVRYFILTSIVFALAPVVWVAARRWRPTRSLLVLGVAAVLVYHPVAMEHRLAQTQLSIERERTISAFLEEQRPEFLLIAADSNYFTVHNFGAVSFSYANKYATQILLEHSKHAYSEIFVAQEVSSEDREIKTKQHLSSVFQLDPIREVAIDPKTLVRISRVVSTGS